MKETSHKGSLVECAALRDNQREKFIDLHAEFCLLAPEIVKYLQSIPRYFIRNKKFSLQRIKFMLNKSTMLFLEM